MKDNEPWSEQAIAGAARLLRILRTIPREHVLDTIALMVKIYCEHPDLLLTGRKETP